jgi:hypothetical protein
MEHMGAAILAIALISLSIGVSIISIMLARITDAWVNSRCLKRPL